MRIKKVQLAGLAAVVLGVTAGGANAEDVTISTATTTPLSTSDPNPAAPVAAGNITLATGGSIAVTAGQTAITVDTDNDVNNGGQLTSNDADNTTGVLIQPGHNTDITSSGSISLIEGYSLTDADSDGDLDGAFAIGTNRHGIFLQSGAAMTGDIVNSGSISIEGNNSSAITLEALLNGNLTSTGSINVVGDNSVGVAIGPDGVNGNVIVRGPMTVRGTNSSGLVIDGHVTGNLIVNGAWSVSGFHSVNRPADVSQLDADDLQLGGPAIAVRASVDGGILIDGVGVEDDQDDDGDTITEQPGGDTDDDISASIIAYGSAPALLIQADPSANLVVGMTTTGFGLHIQGTLVGIGVYDNIDATAVRIEGSAGTIVDISNDIALDGIVQATGTNANAFGMVIGNNAFISELLIRRNLSSLVSSDLSHTAYGLMIESGGSLPILTNTGTVRVQLFGETGDAVAITDASGSLITINNSGSILAQLIATDSDLTDNIPPPPITGSAIAIDVSANVSGVTLNQTPDVPFTDEDGVDDDVNSRPAVLIQGDILFGSGGDTVNLLAGAIHGDIAFGAGLDALNIDNGASFVGGLSDTDGVLNIDVQDGSLTQTGGTTNFTTGTFGADSVLSVTIDNIPANSTFLHSSGTISFAAGAQVIPIVPDGLPVSGTHTFLTADGGLIGAGNVTGVVTGSGSPFLYNLSISALGNSLEAAYVMKTPVQLGLDANQTIAFDPIITALRLDSAAADAFSALPDQQSFFGAYADLMPSYASASTELATTAIQQMQSATTNRMAYTRLQGLDEVSAWVQEIAYGLDRQPPDTGGQRFRGQGFGLAMGIDGPLDNGALFGLSASFLASEAEEPARPEGEISSWFGQGDAYLGAALGPVDLDFVAGAGFGRMRERRFVEIGPSFHAQTEAEWWAWEGHGAIRASLPLALGRTFEFTPQAALTYVGLSEQGYTESGGGLAIDLEADDQFSQRLWGDVGAELSARWNLRGGGVVAPRIYAGYRSNMIDDAADRTFRFVSGGSDFTLADATLGEGGPLVAIGLDATNGYSTFSLTYEGEFGEQIERHSLNASIRFRF